MFPVGTSDSGQMRGVRRYPYIIVPLDSPSISIPGGAIYMEAIVFSLIQHPPEKVLADYCEAKGLAADKFECHPVVFTKDLILTGKGTLCIRQDAAGFRMGVNWKE